MDKCTAAFSISKDCTTALAEILRASGNRLAQSALRCGYRVVVSKGTVFHQIMNRNALFQRRIFKRFRNTAGKEMAAGVQRREQCIQMQAAFRCILADITPVFTERNGTNDAAGTGTGLPKIGNCVYNGGIGAPALVGRSHEGIAAYTVLMVGQFFRQIYLPHIASNDRIIVLGIFHCETPDKIQF